MKHPAIISILLVFLLAVPSASRADLILSITSPNDLNNEPVGSSITFDVSVSGTSADAPGYLSASIQIDPTVLINPMVTPGPIIPNTSGFDSSATGGGTVSAYYDDSIFGTAPITSDGVFFSFTVTRADAEATTLSFSAYAAQDDSGNNISISAAPDSIFLPAAQTVPEPPSWALVIAAACLLVPVRILRAMRRPAPASI